MKPHFQFATHCLRRAGANFARMSETDPPFFFPGERSPSAYQSADGTWLGPCLALGSVIIAARGRAREDGVTRGAEEELG